TVPTDDAAELRRADQRHADPGRHAAQPGGAQRAGAQRSGRLLLLQLHTDRPGDTAAGYRLHAGGTPLAGPGCNRPQGTRAAEHAGSGRAVSAARAGTAPAAERQLAADRPAAERTGAAQRI